MNNAGRLQPSFGRRFDKLGTLQSPAFHPPLFAMRSPIAPLRPIPRLIFFSRWLQLPLYTGLIIARAAYVCLFVVEM